MAAVSLVTRVYCMLLTVICLSILGALLAERAGAQAPPPTGGGTNPVTITFTPASPGTDTMPSLTLLISVCASPLVSDSATYNGSLVSLTLSDGCATKDSTYNNLPAGTSTWIAYGCSGAESGNSGECIDQGVSVSHPAGNVKANGTPVSVSPNQDTSETFYVSNYMSSSMTDTLTATCSGSGVSSCTVSGSTIITVASETPQLITVTYKTASSGTSGTVQLKAKSGSFDDSASVPITVAYQSRLTVSTVYTNSEDQDEGRCYMACFAMTKSMSTVPYVSRDTPRSVTLVYNGDRVASRPIINADVTVASVGGDTTYTLSYLSMAAFIYQSTAWEKVVFVNGDTTIYYSASGVQGASAPYRLMGQFDASSFPNASYPLKMVMTAYYSDGHQDVVTDSSHHIVVYNTRSSVVANGWTILGQDFRLSPEDGGSENESIGRGNGSAILYNNDQCGGSGCTWSPPAGASVATQLLYLNSDTLDQLTYPDSSREYFAPGGHTIWTISRMNDTVFYGYDSTTNRDTAISDPYRTAPGGSGYNGHTYWSIRWNSSGLGIDSIIEPDSAGNPHNPGPGRVTLLTVNQTTGNLTKWKDPDGDSTLFGYDTEGRLDSITDRNGNLTRYTYNANTWKLDSVITTAVPIDTNASGTTATLPLRTYFFPQQTCTLPSGRTNAPPGGTQAQTYETGSYCGYWINPANNATHIQTDQWGQLLALDNTNGYITAAYTRDGNGFPLQVTNSSGQTNAWTYSGPFMTSSTPAGQNTTNYVYGPFAQLDSSYGVSQPTQKNFINDSTYKRGHIDSVEVAGGVSSGGSTTRYYAATSGRNTGRDVTMVDTHSDTTTYGYDTNTGNHSYSSDGLSGRSVTTTFDGHGRVATVTATGTGGTAINTTRYDILNRVDTTYDSYNRATVYGYDSVGNQTSVEDPAGNVYTSVYNAIGWVTSQTDPTGRTTSSTYNWYGSPAVVTNRRGQQITYRYDDLNRLLSVTRPAAFTGDSGTYDSTYYSSFSDSIITMNKVAKNVTYYSRSLGWADSANTWIHGTKIKRFYHHDALGRVDSVAVTDSVSGGFDPYTRHYYYDATYGFLDSLKLRNQKIAYSYTNYQLTGTTYPTSAGSVSRSDTYTSIGTTATTKWSNFGGVGDSLTRAYSYDSTGRIVQVNVDGLSQGDTALTYSYDKMGELVLRQIDTLSTNQSCTTQQLKTGYCNPGSLTVLQQDSTLWDSTGNLDSVKVGAADTAGHVLPGNRLNTWTGLTFYGDSDGNRDSVQSSAATVHYTWSADGLLRQVTQGSATRQYYYDATGQLLFRSDNGTIDQYYLWDNGQILAILDGTATNRVAEFAYAGTDQPIARITGNSTTSSDTVNFLLQDAIGNVFAQWNGVTAAVEQQLAYDPWGAATISTARADTTQLRWKGLLYEGGVTGLYYVRARWYDPVTRRFISPDPQGLAAGINQFAFGGGDPINNSDPSGMDTCDPLSSPGGCAGGDYWNQAAFLASVFGGISCSLFDPNCNNQDLLSQIPGSPYYVDPFANSALSSSWCGNGFSNSQCDALNTAIADLSFSSIPVCAQMGAYALDAFNSGTLVFASNQLVNDLYARGIITTTSVGGVTDPNLPMTGITALGFSNNQYTLTNTIAHEMIHYLGQDLAQDGGDTPNGPNGPTLAYQIGAACQNP